MDDADDPADKGAPPSRTKSGNVGPDGHYLVGKGRPPKHGRFAVGDGRRRGRRPKGQKNFDTEFEEEARRVITLRENGKERRVTKMRSVIVRVLDNAGAKGQNQAIATIFHYCERLDDKVSPPSQALSADEDAMVNAWIEQRLSNIGSGDQAGDPEQPVDGGADSPDPDADDGEHDE